LQPNSGASAGCFCRTNFRRLFLHPPGARASTFAAMTRPRRNRVRIDLAPAANRAATGDDMNNQLRPMALGEILDRTAELYRTHFLLFAGISAIFAGIMLAVQLLYLRSLILLGYPNMMAHWQWGHGLSRQWWKRW
jgi:hypothetical protein